MSEEPTQEEKEMWRKAKERLEKKRNQGNEVTVTIDRTAELKELQKSEYAFNKLKEELAKSYAKRGEFLDPNEIKDYEDFTDKVENLREIDSIRSTKTPSGSIPLTNRQFGSDEGKSLEDATFENPEEAIKFLEDVSTESDDPAERKRAQKMLDQLTVNVARKNLKEGTEWVYEGEIAGEEARKKSKGKWKRKR